MVNQVADAANDTLAEVKDEQAEEREEKMEMDEEVREEMMQSKKCGSLDLEKEEAEECFPDDGSEKSVCCVNIKNPATPPEDLNPGERDVRFETITKVSADPDNLSWCVTSESFCKHDLQGQIMWNYKDKIE